MKKPVLLFLVFCIYASGSGIYSFRVSYGKETDSDLGNILSLNEPTKAKYDFRVFSLDGGYLLKKDTFDIPLDIYLKGGFAGFSSEDLSRYPELANVKNLHSDPVYEITLYIKFYYNIRFLKNNLRIGFGEGGSYVNKYLQPELIEAQVRYTDEKYSKYLNYLDISLDFDIGKLVRYKPLEDTFLGITVKHRSGIFGLINNVKHGGSNYNTISIERNF